MPETPSTGEPTEEQAGVTAAEHQPADTDLTRDEDEPSVTEPPSPAAPQRPQVPSGAGERGQRRITRETHTTTTRSHSETTTHETSTTVEDIAVAPPVYAAPASEHPRPVG